MAKATKTAVVAKSTSKMNGKAAPPKPKAKESSSDDSSSDEEAPKTTGKMAV